MLVTNGILGLLERLGVGREELAEVGSCLDLYLVDTCLTLLMEAFCGLSKEVATILIDLRHLIDKILGVWIILFHLFCAGLELRMIREDARIDLLKAVGHLRQNLEVVVIGC